MILLETINLNLLCSLTLQRDTGVKRSLIHLHSLCHVYIDGFPLSQINIYVCTYLTKYFIAIGY